MKPTKLHLAVLLFFFFGLTFEFLGCSKAREELEETIEPLMALPERTKVRVDLLTTRKAIEFYKVDNDGELPENLKELQLDLYYPGEYDYDSTTGKLKSKNYPGM